MSASLNLWSQEDLQRELAAQLNTARKAVARYDPDGQDRDGWLDGFTAAIEALATCYGVELPETAPGAVDEAERIAAGYGRRRR